MYWKNYSVKYWNYKGVLKMKKALSISFQIIILATISTIIVLSLWLNYKNEIYIQTIERSNSELSTELSSLKIELFETKEQLQESNWKLQQIEMRSEGNYYQESEDE